MSDYDLVSPLTDMPANGSSQRFGVVMLCHGSRRGSSRDECSCSWVSQNGYSPAWCRQCPNTPNGLADASERLQAKLDESGADVLVSCLEFIEPHPDQAVELLAHRGLSEVVIMPYLLGHGKHATEELEEVLDDVKLKTPSVNLQLCEGLGADPRLADLVVDRVRELDGTPGLDPSEERTIGVVVVKAGTKTQYDDCLWLRELGQMAEDRLGKGFVVDVAQSHYGDPTMESAAANLVETRNVSALIYVPYIFFPGMILKRNVLGGMAEAQRRYPEIPMHVTPPLGVDDRVVAVAADRIREARNR